jgi:hypothetical protein
VPPATKYDFTGFIFINNATHKLMTSNQHDEVKGRSSQYYVGETAKQTPIQTFLVPRFTFLVPRRWQESFQIHAIDSGRGVKVV